MGETQVVDGIVAEFTRKLLERYRLSALILFGSRAAGRGTTESDYDFVVVSPDFDGVPFLKRLPDLYELWEADVGVDVLCYTPAEFETLRSQPSIVRDAHNNGVPLV